MLEVENQDRVIAIEGATEGVGTVEEVVVVNLEGGGSHTSMCDKLADCSYCYCLCPTRYWRWDPHREYFEMGIAEEAPDLLVLLLQTRNLELLGT